MSRFVAGVLHLLAALKEAALVAGYWGLGLALDLLDDLPYIMSVCTSTFT